MFFLVFSSSIFIYSHFVLICVFLLSSSFFSDDTAIIMSIIIMMMIIIITIMIIIDVLGRRVLRSPRDSGGWDFTFQSSKHL